jgi:hypothetical protein
MNEQERTETEFERRLRAELRTIVAERGAAEAAGRSTTVAMPAGPAWRRRGPRLGLAGAAVAAVAALVLIVNAGGSDMSAAFAVEAKPEGIVSVEIASLEDATGLEAALDNAGIPASVSYLPAGMTCREPRFRSVPWPHGTRSIVSAKMTGTGPNGGPPFVVSGPLRFSINRGAVEPGQTLVITASAGDDGQGFEGSRGFFAPGSQVDLAEGAVSPCEPVPAAPRYVPVPPR